MVGHVDFKFVLNSNITNIPQLQVTLLKNKAPGLGKVNGKKGDPLLFSDLLLFRPGIFTDLISDEVKICRYLNFTFT